MPAPGPGAPPDAGAAAARLLVLVNEERTSRGLVALVQRDDVTAIAVAHSAAMADAGDIWHNDSYFSPATKRRLGARRVGENVALNRDADDAHRKLMASPAHRDNILDPGFRFVGIAVGVDEEGRIYVTEDFVDPVTMAATATGGGSRPTAVRTSADAAAPQAAAVSIDEPAVYMAPSPDGPRELASGPLRKSPKERGGGLPIPAILLGLVLVAGAGVGIRKVAC